MESLKPLRGLRVLEVGCGDGNLACLMAAQGAIVHGFDLSIRAIGLAIERRNASRIPTERAIFWRGDVDDYKVPWNDYDIVLLNNVLHHMPDRIVLSEPVQLSPTWRKLRKALPKTHASPGERPLSWDDLLTIKLAFPITAMRYFNLFSRLNRNYEHSRLRAAMYGAAKLDWTVLNRWGWLNGWAGNVVIHGWSGR